MKITVTKTYVNESDSGTDETVLVITNEQDDVKTCMNEVKEAIEAFEKESK